MIEGKVEVEGKKRESNRQSRVPRRDPVDSPGIGVKIKGTHATARRVRHYAPPGRYYRIKLNAARETRAKWRTVACVRNRGV